MKFRGGKKRHIKFPYSSFEPEQTQQAFNGAKRHNELFISLVLLCQLLEKKIKIREDKKRPINFSYFLALASSFELASRKKDEISRWQKTPHQISLFFIRA
ncbi:hypothetical protein ACOJIU_11270 [Carnobacterium maltaromaticum]|uniref:hypothetical protein n=1 Tax=Carnobacterium maltaromaticum TaxID=2751 RepID=UPI003B98582F